MGQWDDKSALVTGDSSGIGLAIARRFAAEGATVYLTGRRKAELDAAVAQAGARGIAIQGDASDLGDLDQSQGNGLHCYRAGDAAAVAHIEDRPEAPAPRAGEIQVRVSVSPVHRGDLAATETGLPDGSAGRRLGTEASGVVTAVGPSVPALQAGDRVAVFPTPGAWSEANGLPSSCPASR